MPKILYKRYTLHIDPTFWSTLYGKKLDEWKLDDTEKHCCAFVHGNAVYLDRSSMPSMSGTSSMPCEHDDTHDTNDPNGTTVDASGSKSTIARLTGIVRVFNTRNVLQKYYDENKQSLLQTLLQTQHQFILLVHADLKRYVFDYYFALPTRYPSSPFWVIPESEATATNEEVVSMMHVITKENQNYFLPEVIRNELFKKYKQGARSFEFLHPSRGKIRLNIRCPEYAKIRYGGWKSSTMTSVDMSQTMDPNLIVEQNAELNLKLMMWKHDPELPLGTLRKVNCLLIGAGTVGCTIARNLIAWGVRNITFVDCANVACSNPVRQNLYTINDVGNEKATSAAKTLATILPSVKAKGYTIDIPMPGHPHVGGSERSRLEFLLKEREDYTKLESLIKGSDIIFLSPDSREGRWTTIILAQMYGKRVINVALGYESMVIQNIKEDNACYFCSDPVAPKDTTSTRTIDEKCTITRPGISYIASALAVEMYVDSMRRPLKHDQVRFNFSDMKFNCYNTSKNPLCPCCSPETISQLSHKGYEFIEEVKVEPTILEYLSGYSDECGSGCESDVESMSSENDDADDAVDKELPNFESINDSEALDP